ncbi:MAG: 4a-hydroxytetrahydrobiopterin dehydratase [Polyangiaceae bacterium]|nr:4a-hydroxytetrahydrobiopterin dehydratase [Polyangiaceae bacterium]
MPRDFADRQCLPCEGGVTALSGAEVQAYLARLGGGWTLSGEQHLEKELRFRDFASALRFANRVGELAETEGHHPDMLVGWGRVKIYLWTHAADGLTSNDFVLAAKISRLLEHERRA